MLELENISKSLSGQLLLDNLSFSVQKSELFFILGRSGTGKSVLLKVISGMLHPDSGSIKKPRDCRLSYVFQAPALMDSRSIYENITLGIRHLSSKEKLYRVEKTLAPLALQYRASDLIYMTSSSLSLGEQKIFSIVRALLIDPDIILLDEPTTGLDEKSAENIHQILKSVCLETKKTLIVVSHDIKSALKYASKTLILEKGKIADYGEKKHILSSQIPITRAFLEDII